MVIDVGFIKVDDNFSVEINFVNREQKVLV